MEQIFPEEILTEKFVRLKSISITKEQSEFLYKNKISPQKLLSKSINDLMSKETN